MIGQRTLAILMKPSVHLVALSVFCVLQSAVSASEEAAPRLPSAARQLQANYLKTVEMAVKPIRTRYISDLQKLQATATKAGKLDDALAIKYEIDSVEGDGAGDKAEAHLTGKWMTKWGPFTISSKTCKAADGNTGTWCVRGDELIITWTKPSSIYRFPRSQIGGDKLEGVLTTAQGVKIDTVTLERIK